MIQKSLLYFLGIILLSGFNLAFAQNQKNFIQSGIETTLEGKLTISNTLKNKLYVRGLQVDQYIRNTDPDDIQCLLIPYVYPPLKKTLVLSLKSSSFFNYQTNTREYFYIADIGTPNNAYNCLTIVPYVDKKYTVPTVFNTSSLCPNCSNAHFESSSLEIVKRNRRPLKRINLSNLTLGIQYKSPKLQCKRSSGCVEKGFDCCSEGQSVNQSSEEFIEAFEEISNNPDAIFSYPQFYHFCK